MRIDPRVHVPRALFEFFVWLPADEQFAAINRVVTSFRAIGDMDAAEAFDVDARRMLTEWRARGVNSVGRA
jgi:hypothetical protein